jgi:hypothetical protein
MDLKPHLRGRNLKWNWDSITKHCVENPSSIEDVLAYCTDEETIIQQNAGAVLGKIIDLDKKILIQYEQRILDLLGTDPHDAVKRAAMRVFQFIEIDEEVEGQLFDTAMTYVNNPEEAIAVRAFGMTAARRVCEKYPELANELLPPIEVMVDQKLSSGIVNRGEKELKILRKLTSELQP